jgi:hypothetical protein
MRVVCNSLDEFLGNLMLEPSAAVLQQTVHASVTERPLDGDKKSAVKFQVVFHASAVIDLPDGGQYLLDFGEDCGTDYRDSSKELLGTGQATKLREKLAEFCGGYGLHIRPGIIEV